MPRPPSVSRLGIWIGGGDSTTVAVLAGSGARWTRLIFDWSRVEPVETTPPTYDFAVYDGLLEALGRAGITTIVEFRGNPAWAATTSCGPITRLDRFEAFLTALAARYGKPPYNVKHWEFYNEPDNREVEDGEKYGLGCWGKYPAAYAQMLQSARFGLSRGDPRAVVVMGGIAHEWYPPFFNMDFLDEVLAAGGGPYIDVANIHAYSDSYLRWGGTDIDGKVAEIRRIFAKHRLDRPVAVTELSYVSSPKGSPEFAEMQARYVAKVFSRGLYNNLYAMTWFSLADLGDPVYTDPFAFGLTDVSYQPKDSYRAYQVAAEEFGEARAVRALSPGEVGVAGGVEGYAFQVSSQERWVLWATGAPVEVTLPARALGIRDKLGQPLTGLRLSLTDSPIFVRLGP